MKITALQYRAMQLMFVSVLLITAICSVTSGDIAVTTPNGDIAFNWEGSFDLGRITLRWTFGS